MDFTSDDPELAKELVKLLGQELKTVRAQLRDAQQMARATPSTSVTEDHKDGALLHEIQALRAQNEDLRARSEYLERIAESKPMPFDEDAKHDLLQQLETSRLRADELCREKDEANGALEEALALSQQTEEALVLSQQKRRSAKDSRNEYKTALEEANSRIEEANSQINKANTRLEDTKGLLRDALELTEKSHQSEATVLPKYNSFDPQSFLAAYDTTGAYRGSWNYASIKPYAHKATSYDARKATENLWTKTNGSLLPLNYLDTFWPKTGDISHAITVHTGHVYKSEKPEAHPTLVEGDRRDVVYRDDKTWRYLGTFECVHSDLRISLDQLERKAIEQMLNRAIPKPDLVVPVVSKTVKELYRLGGLYAHGFVLRRVGFNETLYHTLLQQPAQRIAPSKGHPIPIPAPSESKHPLPQGSESGGAKKKQKTK